MPNRAPQVSRPEGARACARGSGGLALAGLAALLLLAGPAAAGELRVGAASSLRGPVDEAARDFGARAGIPVQVSYGASSVLAAQVRAGAPLDLLLSADARSIDVLAAAGLVRERRAFARNRLVVLARPELPALAGPQDLARASVGRIAIPGPAVPVGRYAREWLERHGLAERLEPRLVRTEHARATLVAVDRGIVDVAIVYATDARLARRARVALEIPDADQPEILYVAALLEAAGEPARARDFLDDLIEGEGRGALARAGFAGAGMERR